MIAHPPLKEEASRLIRWDSMGKHDQHGKHTSTKLVRVATRMGTIVESSTTVDPDGTLMD